MALAPRRRYRRGCPGLEELEAQLSGDDITVAFNPHYLVEGLSVIETKFVRFSSLPHPSRR